LYIHVSARTKESLDSAVAKIHELVALDLGSLVEKDKGRERVSDILYLLELPLRIYH